ncbi:DUF2628 domain-containing protein [Sinorhizobium sp. BG8]|uniref:DUF2628 domain-containing protein n=1 Tax=Sinorhizobium sp. BG8 TaxID=2613773 RepID=UPI00193D012F|nr:DUF2628 domain-containing protein [Sinorhizobium sp. BG8]QRM53685.1 DUF2628 domain-containing protein [Sinorhizobium sp. BG8]
MASYLVLTPPGKNASAEDARFIRDGFRWTAFFFPALWLLFHRLWFWGIAALAVQFGASALAGVPGFAVAGFAIQIGLSVLVALEGPMLAATALARRQWSFDQVTLADNIDEAETIYFSVRADSQAAGRPTAQTGTMARGYNVQAGQGPALGLIGYDGDRQ